MEDTLLESLALSSVESVSTLTGAMEQNLLGCSDTDIEVTEPEDISKRPPAPRPPVEKLSGAARRKRRRLAAAQAAAQAEGGQAISETSLATPVLPGCRLRPERPKRGLCILGALLRKCDQLPKRRRWTIESPPRSRCKLQWSLKMTQLAK